MAVKTTANNAPPSEVDVIVVGGGAAGAVVAGRLAKADPTLQIAIIEAGVDNSDVPTSHQPAMYISHLAPTSTTANFYASAPSDSVNGRACVVPVGGLLGGGSSINFLMYTRGAASDYNDWNQEGWAFEDLLPLVKKTETNHLPKQTPKVHGDSGNLHVSYGGHQSKLGAEWLKAADVALPDLPYSDDIQDFKTGHAKTTWGKWIDPKTGRRQDTAHGFIHPVVKTQTNLHVLCESKTIRVVFDESSPPKAVGVEYCVNPLAKVPLNPEQPPTVGETFTMKAKKYVVLSSGAFGTPAILERSGVGAKEVLEKAGIDVVVDLEGVGKEYDDHQLALGIYVMADDADTHDEFLRGNPEVHAVEAPKWAENGQGMVASNAIDAGAKLRPTQAEVDAMGSPEFSKIWEEKWKNSPDKPVMFGGIVSTFLGDHALLPPNNKYAMCGQFDMSRKSRGHVHITSKDPFAAPDFQANYMKDSADLPPHIWAYKTLREVMRRMPSYRGELAPTAPKFAETSEARCLDKEEAEKLTKSGNIQNIKYTKEDDKAIEAWVRENIGTTWHSMSTAPMKARSEGGVVDNRLNVYGTQNLKLADLSICPSNVASNTYSVALTVGEKAAVILGEDLGITV